MISCASYVIYNLDWAATSSRPSAELGPNYRERVGEVSPEPTTACSIISARWATSKKMYIPPDMDKKASPLENQVIFERALAEAVGFGPGDKVLDLGCGRGRVAARMASVTGAHMAGPNIDPNQIAQAPRV